MRLRQGKLPAALLAELLASLEHRDSRVLVGPALGRDAAVIDVGGGNLIVATTDPVTFTAERLGWYAVNVNANDVACMGATPSWFLATALLPEGATDAVAREIFDDLRDVCGPLGIEMVGGHTEVTSAVQRPMVIGTMLGTASRDEIVTGENAQAGDGVLLTKGIAIEGTALLARDCGDELAGRGVGAETIERARTMLFEPGISVVADARTICAVARPRLMHDVTEGGLATALREVATAANATLVIDRDATALFEETRAVCEALALDPMGLLASGALVAVVNASDCAGVISALRNEKIECRQIGRVESGESGVILDAEGSSAPLPTFERDELARFYDERGGDSLGSHGGEGP